MTPADQAAPLGAVTRTATVDYEALVVRHAALEPQTGRQGPMQGLSPRQADRVRWQDSNPRRAAGPGAGLQLTRASLSLDRPTLTLTLSPSLSLTLTLP